jgi:hypothetical protein
MIDWLFLIFLVESALHVEPPHSGESSARHERKR